MSDSPISAEPGPADSESPPTDVSSRGHEGSRDNGVVAMALIVGVLIGVAIGMRIGNDARKRLDRWRLRY
jgi:hypothetical protein